MYKVPKFLRFWLSESLLSLILMLCMVVGITVFVLLTIHITYQLSWDEHLPNCENTWRIQMTRESNNIERSSTISNEMFRAMLGRLPQIRDWYMILPVLIEHSFIYEDRNVIFDNINYCSRNFPELLDLKMVYGTRNNCFPDETSMIISHSKAQEIFGDIDPTGERLLVWDDGMLVPRVTISGVFEDQPQNQHLQGEAYGYMNRYDLDRTSTVWENPTTFGLTTQIYAVLEEGTDPQILVDEAYRIFEENRGNIEDLADGEKVSFRVTRLDDIHYDDNTDEIFDYPKFDRRKMTKYGVVALAILMVLVTNSMILLTVRVMSRRREIDIRRSMGASGSDILRQFVKEHLWLYCLMIALSAFLIHTILPWLHLIIPGFTVDNTNWQKTVYVSLLGLLAAGAIIVVYPALVARTIHFGKRSTNYWKLAMLIQLIISIILMVSAILLFRQVHFLTDRSPGFDASGITSYLGAGARQLPQEDIDRIMKIPGVESVTSSTYLNFTPVMYYFQESVTIHGHKSVGNYRQCGLGMVEANFFDVFRIDLLQGHVWEDSDSTGVLVNRTFMDRFAVHGIGMGTHVKIGSGDPEGATFEGPIIGVVEDTYWRGMRYTAAPIVFKRGGDIGAYYHFRIAPSREIEAQKQIMEILEDNAYTGIFFPEMYDTDWEVAHQYDPERNFMRLTVFIAALGMFFTFVGIYGLTAYTLRRQMKNLAIRKVLGSSSIDTIWILLRSYLALLGIALGISIPIAVYLLQKWLQGFSNGISLTALDFAAALIAGIILILLAVVIHWIRFYRSNLIKFLRTE